MWVLLVEDDLDLADVLQTGLEEAGYVVDMTADGVSAEVRALSNEYDLLIVDWMLPGQDGVSLVKRLRSAGCATPVMMLTALADVEHRVQGLDVGADDYLTKPFSFEELYARVRALARRSSRSAGHDAEMAIQAGQLQLHPNRRVAELSGHELMLRTKEYALLELLARRHNAVVTRTVIAERIWGSPLGVSDDVINMTISTLRQKLRDALQEAEMEQPIRIKTVRGVGYSLVS